MSESKQVEAKEPDSYFYMTYITEDSQSRYGECTVDEFRGFVNKKLSQNYHIGSYHQSPSGLVSVLFVKTPKTTATKNVFKSGSAMMEDHQRGEDYMESTNPESYQSADDSIQIEDVAMAAAALSMAMDSDDNLENEDNEVESEEYESDDEDQDEDDQDEDDN